MIEYHSRNGALARVFSWVIVLIMMIGSLELVEQNANYYQASLLTTPQAKPFNGTVTPIEKVPSWVALTEGEWDKNYVDLSKLVDLPKYDPDVLDTPTEDLKWGNAEHDKIRNAKITYATPYLGSYKLDGLENVGSHLAIDIKTATDTPVRSIMNGVVVKAANQSTGFGKHIVIKHVNVPSFADSGSKETLYSSYSHLNSMDVAEGDAVDKGDVIGSTGESGTATTPHLHFQIDNSSAPWHPYWPFTWKEAQDAGLNFFEAVNEGLGMEKAKEYTVNPMVYVQKHINNNGVQTTKPVKEKIEPVKETPKKESNKATGDFQVQFTTQKEYSVEDGKITVIVRLVDEQGQNWEKGWNGYIKVSLLNNTSTIEKEVLEAADFAKGKSKVALKNLVAGETQLVAEFGDKKFYSPVFQILGETEAKTVEAEATPVAAGGIFTDIDEDNEHYIAIKYLYDEKIISGYPDGSFKPDKKVSRVEALKFITEALVGKDKKVYDPKNLPFADTELGVWYSGYVATAQLNGLVNGYPDKTFRPAQDVNLAEFSKIALNAIDAKVPETVKVDPYSDVEKDQWYAPFIAYAKQKNFLDEDRSKVYPGEAMTRADVAEFIFRIMVMKEVGSQKYHPKLLGDMPGLTF